MTSLHGEKASNPARSGRGRKLGDIDGVSIREVFGYPAISIWHGLANLPVIREKRDADHWETFTFDSIPWDESKIESALVNMS